MKIMISQSSVKSERIAYLEDILTRAKAKYEIGEYLKVGKLVITDPVYDKLEAELKQLKPTSKVLHTAGANVVGREKVPLPFPMYSLDKGKPEDGTADKWLKTHKGPYHISDKEDGNSLELVWENKKWEAYTRGKNGTVGSKVSRIVPHLRIPQSPKVKFLVVRGEAVMPVSKFSQFSKETRGEKDGYDNPRNLVAGAINKFKEKHEALEHIDFIAYEIIEPRTYKPSEAFAKLKELGFKVAPNKTFATLTVEQLQKILVARKEKSVYEIDGLVIEQDKINKRPPPGTHHPDYAIAFKMDDEDQIKVVPVTSVTWEETKYGLLIPVINIAPLRLSGVTVKNFNGRNAFFIEHGYNSKLKGTGLPERPINKGALIKVKRSGEVIPHIMEVMKGAKTPSVPDVPYERKGIQYVATEQTSLVLNKQIESFFKILGIENIGVGVAAKLSDAGFDTVMKIINAQPKDFVRAEGIQVKLAQRIWDSIHSKLDSIPLDKLMAASAVFGTNWGVRRFTAILKAYPTILDLSTEPAPKMIARIQGISGFKELAKDFAAGLPKFVMWLKKSGLKPVMPKTIKVKGSNLKGQVVVFTGFRNKVLEEDIQALGGTVGSSVSGKTTILLVSSMADDSTKVQKARALGVDIMTEVPFKKKYGIK